MSLISRSSEVLMTAELNSFLTLCLRLSQLTIWPFSTDSLNACPVAVTLAAYLRRKCRQDTTTTNRPNIIPNKMPASTSHQWCRWSLTLVNEHVTAHMLAKHCSHGFSNRVRLGRRFCRYHCTQCEKEFENQESTNFIPRDENEGKASWCHESNATMCSTFDNKLIRYILLGSICFYFLKKHSDRVYKFLRTYKKRYLAKEMEFFLLPLWKYLCRQRGLNGRKGRTCWNPWRTIRYARYSYTCKIGSICKTKICALLI